MPDPIETYVIDAISRWAERQVAPPCPPRIDMRFVFGNPAIAEGVSTRLAGSAAAHFAVRSSGDADSVRLRNHMLPRPTGLAPGAPFVYLVFWLPGMKGHDSHAQSLADLRAVDVPQVLAGTERFVLPWEEEIARSAQEAAQAWGAKNQARAAEHLSLAWTAVRKCLREGFGGVQRSIPFCPRLEDYGRFLSAARVPEVEWQALAPRDRAARLLRQWGEALPELGMFRMPALAAAMNVATDPGRRPERISEAGWAARLERILAENIDAAVDFSSLGDRIAGKRTVEQQLEQLKHIGLSSTAPQKEAREQLSKFCREGDTAAFRVVDWLFFKERAEAERQSSLGLKGLLIARGGVQPAQRGARQQEDPGAQDVTAPDILLGLALLSKKNLAKDSGGRLRIDPPPRPEESLRLKVVADGKEPAPIEIPTAGWTEDTIERLYDWMLSDVRKVVFATEDEEPEDEEEPDEEEEEEQAIQISVERGRSGNWTSFGRINLEWSPRARRYVESTLTDGPSSWSKNEQANGSPGRMLQALFGEARSGKTERCPAELNEAWNSYQRSFGAAPGWAAVEMLAPAGPPAKKWVEAWAKAVAQISAGADDKRKQLEKERDAAIDADDLATARRLKVELEALTKSDGFPELTLEDKRSVLAVCTGSLRDERGPVRLLLTAHHPLHLRLRYLSGLAMCEILQFLWTEGWEADGLETLNRELDSSGLPDPVHVYGFQPPQPLVFEDWVLDRFALFSRLGAAREADAQKLGAKQVAGVVEHYSKLFPAAADRLHIRVRGDREGRWGWEVLDLLVKKQEEASCDIDLVTDLPRREASAIERAIQVDEERRRAFEPGEHGVAPRVRVRRRQPDEHESGEPIHLALVVGDEVPEFRAELKTVPGESGTAGDLWDLQVLFEETRPELFEAAITVGDRSDSLSRNVARAVGFAMAERGGLVYRESYAFDPGRCERPLKRIQSGAHWLALASRQPLYRAVQEAGPQVAALLDFYSTVERGRPVHVCVSLNADWAAGDLRRLDAALIALFGPEAAEWAARAVVAAATRFAPGLAMRCAGAATTADIEGLVGLLLTGQETRRSHEGAVALSLDQHQRLLTGSGKLGDVLIVGSRGGRLSITVGESKFSASAGGNGAVVEKAREQIRSTVSRLQRLADRNPLSARVRAGLARALVHQIHLTKPSRQRAAELDELVKAASDPCHPIVIEPESAGEIHVWSSSQATTDEVIPGHEGSAPIQLHGRTTTLARLQELVPM